jgi:hypothetical protein
MQHVLYLVFYFYFLYFFLVNILSYLMVKEIFGVFFCFLFFFCFFFFFPFLVASKQRNCVHSVKFLFVPKMK